MGLTFIAVLGVISIVAIAVVSQRIGVAAPLALSVVGLILSYIPGVPHVEVEGQLVLTIILPPILYAAAVHMPTIDFRRNFRAIFRLSVVLVCLTTLCTGFLLNWLIPGLGLALGFAVGAIISPPDAVAAISIGKKLGLPSRLTTILEGEGLVNDASALVLLAAALASVANPVPLWRVGTDFLLSVIAATVIGTIVGLAAIFVRSRVTDTVANTALSFVVPFLAFLPAEELHASGVLAVVVAGLVVGHLSPRFIRARDRMAENINWQTISFLLESAVFLLMGLQLRGIIEESTKDPNLSAVTAICYGLLVTLLAIVLRILFVWPLAISLRRNAEQAQSQRSRLDGLADLLDRGETLPGRLKRADPERFKKRLEMVRNDSDFLINESIGWRGATVLAWSGMRGAVTVAAASTLPADNNPYRPHLMLIAFVVAVVTLLLQGFTLPWVIKVVKVPGDDATADRAAAIQLQADLSEYGQAVLDDPELALPDGKRFEPVIVDRVRQDYLSRRAPVLENLPEDVDPREQYRDLAQRVLTAQQEELLQVRSAGAYSSRVLTHTQEQMDVQLARLQQG